MVKNNCYWGPAVSMATTCLTMGHTFLTIFSEFLVFLNKNSTCFKIFPQKSDSDMSRDNVKCIVRIQTGRHIRRPSWILYFQSIIRGSNYILYCKLLTPSLRRPCIHAIFFPTACRTACKHAFCFLRVFPEAVSTRHSWLWQTLDDVYTRRCFAESEGTRFGAPGQKALPSVNEFTLLWNFA